MSVSVTEEADMHGITALVSLRAPVSPGTSICPHAAWKMRSAPLKPAAGRSAQQLASKNYDGFFKLSFAL